MHYLATVTVAAFAALMATPALATITVPIPEPTSMSLVAAAAGIVVAWRATRRK